jgi:hypothetical protein
VSTKFTVKNAESRVPLVSDLQKIRLRQVHDVM